MTEKMLNEQGISRDHGKAAYTVTAWRSVEASANRGGEGVGSRDYTPSGRRSLT